MAEADMQVTYSLLVTGAHVCFAILVLRLYQIAKTRRLCHDGLLLRVGVILAVTGTLTIASIPISEVYVHADQQTMTRDAIFWSGIRTSGLLILCFVLMREFVHSGKWNGVERRSRARSSDPHSGHGPTLSR